MARPKRNLALLDLPERAETPAPLPAALPATVEDLAGFELMSQCDRCGRLHRVYPSGQDLHARMRLVDLIGTLLCRARHGARLCGGRPRRLILSHEGRAIEGSYHHLSPQWTLDASGEWVEEDSAFWEESDFAR
ncbi:MAG TPA: hypothetical protein VHE77_11520 [Dongiaceae bacterium]|jgi:hypothetical protein|nr:hypothetical protein [Dongiaceae bacterium]